MIDAPRYVLSGQADTTQPADRKAPKEWIDTNSWDGVVFEDGTGVEAQREAIARLVSRLKVRELRELAIDMLDNALLAFRESDTERLRATIVSWLETAEVTIGTRRRAASILAARDEGRAEFGSPQGELPQERRKVRRKAR